MRGRRAAIALGAACLAVGGWIVFFEARGPSTVERLRERRRIWPGFEPAQAARIELDRAGAAVVLERTAPAGGGGAGEAAWRMTAPAADRVDEAAVRALLDALAYGDSERSLARERPEYGLAPPRAMVRVTLANGGARSLALGAPDASGRAVYARAGDGPVLVLPRRLLAPVEEGPDALRDPRLLPGGAAPCELELGGGGSTVLRRQAGGTFVVESAGGVRAEPGALAELERRLGALRVSRRLPNGSGGTAPRRWLRWRDEDGDTRVSFAPAPAACAPGEVEADRSGGLGPLRGCVDARAVDALFEVAARLPDDRLVDAQIALASLRRIAISAGGRRVALERSQGRWRFAGGGEADEDAVRDWLARLQGVRATRIVPLPPLLPPAPGGTAATGPSAGAATIEIETEASACSTLAILPSVLSGLGEGTSGSIAVRRDAEPAVLLVPGATAAAVFRPDPLEFRPRTVLSFSRYDVLAVRRRARRGAPGSSSGAAGALLVPEAGGEAWGLARPAGAAADPAAVDAMLSTLSALHAERFVARAPASAGLDPPVLDLALTLRSGDGLELGVGRDVAAGPQAGCYGRLLRGGDATPFVLPASVCAALRAPLATSHSVGGRSAPAHSAASWHSFVRGGRSRPPSPRPSRSEPPPTARCSREGPASGTNPPSERIHREGGPSAPAHSAASWHSTQRSVHGRSRRRAPFIGSPQSAQRP